MIAENRGVELIPRQQDAIGRFLGKSWQARALLPQVFKVVLTNWIASAALLGLQKKVERHG